MALQPDIALGVQVPAPINPLATAAQIESVAALRDQREAMAEQRREQAQKIIDAAADKASINAAVQAANGDPYEASKQLRLSGKATAADQLDAVTSKNRQEAETAIETHLKNQGMANDHALSLLQSATPDNWNVIRGGVLGIAQAVDPNSAQQFNQLLPQSYNKDAIDAVIKGGQSHKDYVDGNLAALKELQSGNVQQGIALALSKAPDQTQGDLLGKSDVLKSIAGLYHLPPESLLPWQQMIQSGAQGDDFLNATLTPEQRATNAANAAREAETKRHNLAEEANAAAQLKLKQEAQKAAGGMDDEALARAATRYHETGELPNLGMGGGPARLAIMNKESQMFPPTSLAANTAAFKANQATLTQLTRQLAAVDAFSSTAQKNLQMFLDTAKNVPDSGIPWLNTPIRSVARNAVGSENVAAFDAARQVALTEISRVVNNPTLVGVLSDSARREVSQLDPANATFNQIKRVATVLQQDMANRHDGLADQIQGITDRLKAAGGTGSTGGAQTGGGGNQPTVTMAELEAVAKMKKTTVEQEKARALAAGYIVK